MKRLPIGVQNFRDLIQSGLAYVDKTEQIHQLVMKGSYYFLSRPRRFGKSLLLTTLASLFRGERHLFESLWISETDFPWESHPVILLDFSRLATQSREELVASLNGYLVGVGADLGVSLVPQSRPADTLAGLIKLLRPGGRVVLLIDEYDHPLVRNLTDMAVTQANRQLLHDFFSMIKSLQAELRFVLITGVSRFSRISLFSGMNNLADISLNPQFATLLGLTEDEINQYLDEHVLQMSHQQRTTVDAVIDALRKWYDGYQFSRRADAEQVFNPWSILNCLNSGEFENYWFASGTPSFAAQLIMERGFPVVDLEAEIIAGVEIEGNHSAEKINLVALLFQTGYLTIERYEPVTGQYYLRIPNEEVRRSLIYHLFETYAKKEDWQYLPIMARLADALKCGQLANFFETFNQLLSDIPYPMHVPREGYYQSLLFLCVRTLGFSIDAEVLTSRGRLDLVVQYEKTIYILEFKINGSAKQALDQILSTAYADRFRKSGKQIVCVGVNCSSKTRSVNEWLQTVLP
jgi:hypothetical protein